MTIILSEDEGTPADRALAEALYKAKAANSRNIGPDGAPLPPYQSLLPAERAGWVAAAQRASQGVVDPSVKDPRDQRILELEGQLTAAQNLLRARGEALSAAGPEAGIPFQKPRTTQPTEHQGDQVPVHPGAEPELERPLRSGEAPLTGQPRPKSDDKRA